MIGDPLFWLAAVPGVLLFGISKGGFAGGFGIVTVPLMALAIAPAQAAAILLPILLVMDVGAVWAYRKHWNRSLIKVLLPAGLVGTAIGTLAFRELSSNSIRLFLGALAIGFVLWRTLRRERSATPGRPSVVKGAFWATLSGLTSFIAHSGGPPLSVYLLPLRLAPSVLVGTVAVLFAALNWAKVLPYWWLGLFSAQNLLTSAALAPVGVAGVALGVWLHKRVSETLFYRLVYAFLLLTGAKLLYDGFS
ncbi:MAG: hypothetical protein A2Z64_12805 [Betaproteobacteria bacterium RIFCSPLOWO2_02_67_12]|nr:MAG: hypothetical protein A2Z64_12805 [Betaproteobacteria bacterium RIFCSPLOWO2_02_67_12]